MSNLAHKLFISVLVIIVFFTLITISYRGISYYRLPVEERFYHPDHNMLKPSGILGHGMGIFGSLFIITGVSAYMIRKRLR